MTGTQWVLLVVGCWVALGAVLAATAALLLTRARRRLVWDDTLPLEPAVPQVEVDVEEATA